jgi:pyruvyltransferase
MRTFNLYWWNEVNNFGDLLAPYILQRLFNMENPPSRAHAKDIDKVLSTGSIIHFAQPNDVILGSGIWSVAHKPKNRTPLQILCVRGPHTAAELRNLGYQVPRVYCDPAAIMPELYPRTEMHKQMYALSVAPHFKDVWLRREAIGKDCHMIDVTHSNPLYTLDEILRSDTVITSSLHILIVAEAYGIPAALLRNRDHARQEQHFKYVDYFASTNRDDETVWNSSLEDAYVQLTSRNYTPFTKPDTEAFKKIALDWWNS